jgi:hypothetical protein
VFTEETFNKITSAYHLPDKTHVNVGKVVFGKNDKRNYRYVRVSAYKPNEVCYTSLAKVFCKHMVKIGNLIKPTVMIGINGVPVFLEFVLIKGEEKYAVCSTCKIISAKTKRCGGCKIERYCSVECQKRDWVNHKQTCKRTRSSEVVKDQTVFI